MNLMKYTDDIQLSNQDGNTDYTFLSKDCFHLSQKGHSKFKLFKLSPSFINSNFSGTFRCLKSVHSNSALEFNVHARSFATVFR